MDSTPGTSRRATTKLTRRDALFALAASLSGVPAMAHNVINPVRISIIFDFANEQISKTVAGMHAYFDEQSATENVRIRDVDLALIDLAMTADEQRPQNLVIGIGDSTAKAFSAKQELFATGQSWVGAIRDDAVDMGNRNIRQHLLRPDYDFYLAEMQRVMPNCKKIGILHDEHASEEMRSILDAAERTDLQTMCAEVHNPSEIEAGIAQVADEADVLFGLRCKHIYNELTARRILSKSFSRQLPMIGLSSEWVRAGALLSMDWNAAKVGSDLAAWALDDWGSVGSGKLIVDSKQSDAAHFHINRKSAAHFGLTLDNLSLSEGVTIYD